MQIRRVVIENYRSIERVELSDLGDFVVLYGPNGSGKTNILRAIGCALALLGAMARENLPAQLKDPRWLQDVFQPSDFRLGTRHAAFEVEVAFSGEPGASVHGVGRFSALRFRFALDTAGGNTILVSTVHVRGDLDGGHTDWDIAKNLLDLAVFLNSPSHAVYVGAAGAPANLERLPREQLRDVYGALRVLLNDTVAAWGFQRIEDVRGFGVAPARPDEATSGQPAPTVEALLREGRVEEAISRAATSGDDHYRERFELLRDLLTRPPLNLPDIDAVVPNGQYRLRVRATRDRRATVESTAASLGVQQIIVLLGALLFGRSRTYGIEEPEAHLHAPTSGRALRQVLSALVKDRTIDQLFVATHSNLFDLDSAGFWSVRNEGATTTAEHVRELSRIDQDHLFEPGAAKRVLQDLLRIEEGDRVVATGKDGPITARQMLIELQDDTETGVRYAAELSRAAARRFLRTPPDLTRER